LRTADAYGFEQRVMVGAGFELRVFLNRRSDPVGDRLHVYIDGDGTPWLGPGRPAADPTPRNPLALRLMALDPKPAIYLGRPCYVETGGPEGCGPWHWTHGRYSAAVVESMHAVLRRLLAELPARQVVLIGFSGGGTLAMLLAARLRETVAVVTLGGNLDVAGWTRHHGYSPLVGSLDPASQPPLPKRIRQWHWVGARDRVVPPQLVVAAVSRQPQAAIEVLPNADHQCCWEELWPSLLQQVR
jgi:pimeloyl-ACP methyl ester carboxylesterase